MLCVLTTGYHGRVMPSRLYSPFLIALAAMLWGSDLLLRPNALSAGWSPAWLVLGEHLLLSLLFLPILWHERLNLAALTVILLQKTQPIVAILLAGLVLKERCQPLF